MNPERPIIEEIILLSGEIITNARLEICAPRLPGFIAIVSQELKSSTQYISHSAIQSFTMRNDELDSTSPTYYLTPGYKVKVEK